MRFWYLLGALAGLCFVTGTANADGRWSGFYVGAHGGGAWADADYFEDNFDEPEASFDLEGAVAGVHVGYNLRTGPWVFGIEGDYSGTPGMDDQYRFGGPNRFFRKIEIDGIASVRGRAGYAFGDVLLFGTGGWSWVDVEINANPGHNLRTTKATLDGWTAGGGFEYAIAPNVTFRTEYLYINIDDVVSPGESSGFDEPGMAFDEINIVRAGITLELGGLP